MTILAKKRREQEEREQEEQRERDLQLAEDVAIVLTALEVTRRR